MIPSKLRQLFCRHKNTTPHIKREPYLCLSGQTVYHICDRCRKIVREEFVSTEEFPLRYRTR